MFLIILIIFALFGDEAHICNKDKIFEQSDRVYRGQRERNNQDKLERGIMGYFQSLQITVLLPKFDKIKRIR